MDARRADHTPPAAGAGRESWICTAQSDERILLWRAEVESAGLRLPEKTQEIVDAVRARVDTAKAILATTLNTELPRVQLRSGILLEPGLLAELPTFKCQQHIWSCSQPDWGFQLHRDATGGGPGP